MKEKVIKLIILLVLFTNIAKCQTVNKETLYFAQFNVENLFDALDDPETNDAEFLPESDKFWTEGKVNMKLNNLAKVISYMNNGKGPDVLGIEEVENFNMMKRLCYALQGRDYISAHRDSKDARGIDVGLIYDRKVFQIEDLKTIEVLLPTKYPTRDILHVTLKHKKSGEIIHFFVNHWPSRLGGKEKSDVNRAAAAGTLKSALELLFEESPNANVVLLGDFNDEPQDESILKVLNAQDFKCGVKHESNTLLNLAYKKAEHEDGSYLYARNWDMIDQIIVSSALNDGKGIEYECDSYEIVKPDYMIIESGDRKGGALPTYMGKKYIGGFSDHFPVGASFYIKAD